MRCRGRLRLARPCPGQPIPGTARLDQLAKGPDLVDDLGLVLRDDADLAAQALDGGGIVGDAGASPRRRATPAAVPARARAGR